MAEQLAFDLPVRPALGRDAFFVSPANETALQSVEDWERWPGKRQLIIGPRASGKTHLAHVWAGVSRARILAGSTLTSDAVPTLVKDRALAVEDIDKGVDHAALFHLLNLSQAEGTPLLLTTTRPPADWQDALPDLASRLTALPVARLQPPDDALLAAVLVKLFGDRQLAVTPSLITYLVSRIERSFEAAHAVVAGLDAAALETGRALNSRLAGKVLETLETGHA